MKLSIVDQYGITQEFNIKDGERKGDVIIETYSMDDVDTIIEQNKKEQLGDRQTIGKGTQTSMYKLGSLSHLQVYNLKQQGVYDDDKRLRTWFNDLNNYLWRTVAKKRKGGG